MIKISCAAPTESSGRRGSSGVVAAAGRGAVAHAVATDDFRLAPVVADLRPVMGWNEGFERFGWLAELDVAEAKNAAEVAGNDQCHSRWLQNNEW